MGEPAEGQGKFLALYEVATGDFDQTMAALRENVSKKREQGRMTELVRVVSWALYKQITKTQESKKWGPAFSHRPIKSVIYCFTSVS